MITLESPCLCCKNHFNTLIAKPSKMSAIPVADTISEIMERMSSLRGFGPNMTENIKHHLIVIKDKCSSPAKLDLTDPATREWVGQVTDLFYLVDDLCADVALLSKQSKMMSLFSACNLKPLLQLKQIGKRLLREVAPMKSVKMLPNRDAEEEEAETVVRDYVKDRIKDRILEKEEGVVIRAVIIEGITGMGKGRAANYVCEDESVKSGFDVVTWIDCVHLQEHYAESVVDRVKHELEEMKNRKGSGEGKGFLVVLNNFQNVNREEWLKLALKLKEVTAASSGGGTLLVTTMVKAVDYLVRSWFQSTTFRFDLLDPSQSLALFERIAGASWSAIESETRDGLLDMCGGILGAIGTMARLVRSRKPTTESDINELKDKFMKDMLLKYHSELDFPSWRLWQCFAYSSFIFSSQNSVKGKELVRLWMAEGFLGHSSSSSSSSFLEPEDLGDECIEEFLRRSIFKVNEDGKISIYKKNLATVVVGNDSVYMEDKDKGIINNDFRRVSLSSNLNITKGIPRSLFKANKKVHTFLLEKQSRVPERVMLSWFACDSIFSTFKRLRVLTLKNLGMKVLPASIGDLKSLRYLDLSCNGFKKLPIFIGELQHLQTLLLSHCLWLRELPDDGNHFPSLRHLEVDECLNLRQMPSALRKRTRLRSLPHFAASSRNGVGELLHLNEIRGELEISHLERFKFKRSEHAHAYLKEKHHLEGLTLRWNHDDEDGEEKPSSEDNQNEIMLKHLEPHPILNRLSVVGYGGNQFAGWLSSLNNLVEISLYNCSKCQSLPTLDHVLINLKKLTLVSLDSLRFITDGGCEELRLERVQISDCPKLVSWWKSETSTTTVFSAISELVLEYCPKLVSMPLFPEIDYNLILDSSNMKPLLNTLTYKSTEWCPPPLSRLTQLTIVNVDEKQYPQQEEWLKNFTFLERFEIRDCKALKSITGWKYLAFLESLRISNCTDIDLPSQEWQGMETLRDLVIKDISDLKSLPEGVKHLALLNNLEIKNCPELTTLPMDFAPEPLSTIFIEDCPKLASLPEWFQILRRLDIRNCPLLEAWNQSKPEVDFNFLHRLDNSLE